MQKATPIGPEIMKEPPPPAVDDGDNGIHVLPDPAPDSSPLTAHSDNKTVRLGADVESSTAPVVADMEHMAIKALHVDDDPTLNPWTLRMFVLGILLSVFGSALATIFLFKPQSVSVSVIFLTVVSYVLGEGLAELLPRHRWLNPHPFNSKEHLAIIIMSGTASGASYATEVLATQKLYYNVVPHWAMAVLLLLSSQLLGYGMAGVLRTSLVYPTRMLWPGILPLCALVETLHRDRDEMRRRFNFFWVVLGAVAVWELLPQYVMPILTGISVFCLANQRSLVFTHVFGGANGNEGLGLLSACLDWQYVGTSGFFLPLVTLTNQFIGYVLCTALFVALYYGNVWRALSFPFLSQALFSSNSTSTHFRVYNQSAILDRDFKLDVTKLDSEGLPWFSATNASYLLTTNLGIAATVVHVLLWNRDAVRSAWQFGPEWWAWMWVERLKERFKKPLTTQCPRAKEESACGPAIADGNLTADGATVATLPSSSQEKQSASSTTAASTTAASTTAVSSLSTPSDTLDPHHRAMLAYAEVPSSWYLGILLLSITTALVATHFLHSTLPWWSLLFANLLSFLFTLFFGAMAGLIGFSVPITSIVQLIGGYLHPGRPVANMYFVLFGANSQAQALGLVGSLKLGQYGKLSPRCTFATATIGTVLGAIVNYVLMSSITTNQREVLLSVEGTNIWSGQVIQSFNSHAIAFGALSKYMFSPHRTYVWVLLALPLGLIIPIPSYLLHRRFPNAGFDQLITPVICWFLGFLCVGINSSTTIYFVLGFFVQIYVRRRHPRWFLQYNYLLAAAISGGTEFLVFVTTFAVQGASGKEIPFPPYWGNNWQNGTLDFCATNPALGSGG